MQFLAIVFMCIISAMVYGIVHDQVTARVCVEYFSIGHPQLFQTDNPTLLGIGWGIAGTWWVGLIFGLSLAIIARAGSRPAFTATDLIRGILVLLAVMAMFALLAGILGWTLPESGTVFLVAPLAEKVPADKQTLFIADLWAHGASYLAGLVGGVVIMVRTWRSRCRAASITRIPNAPDYFRPKQ